MAKRTLPELLPDVVLLVRRDGVVLEHVAGREVFGLDLARDPVGQSLESLWPEALATLVKPLVRRAIADRSSAVADFRRHGRDFAVKVTAQGPERAICVIRPAVADARAEGGTATGDFPAPQFDRRGFLRRFKESMSSAALREKSTAVAIIHVDGVTDIARIIDTTVSEQIVATAVRRLAPAADQPLTGEPFWYMGQLSEGILALVLESVDRDAIEACLARIFASLRAPISVGDATFHLTPYGGVAVLGRDASSPKMLLDHARAAAAEARRSGATRACFFTDTLQLRSLARLDIACELRDAIADGAVNLRYVGRHDLTTGRLVARVGYLRWTHPLRGEVPAAEFVRVAAATGLAQSLSRSAFACLRRDYAAMTQQDDSDVRVSFGALRHHVLQDDFVADVERFLAEGSLPAQRLELRISERTFIGTEPATLMALRDKGIQLVIDEVGRGMSSLVRLARAPLWGLQLDRSWATALRRDPVALKVCRAGMSVATALGLTPIATGVDDPDQRQALLALGCRHGMGDLYEGPAPEATAATPSAA